MSKTDSVQQVQRALQALANPDRAKHSQQFFKTGPGEYAAGDQFRGITVPQQRNIAKQFKVLPLIEVDKLLQSPWHEDRLTALFILVQRFQSSDVVTRKKIFTLYLQRTSVINNWDLVDSSAEYIVGQYLLNNRLSLVLLKRLAKSKLLWDRRIAIISTFAFIKAGNPNPTLIIAKLLLQDQHDLIHKAVGWMLREVGKRCSETVEETFLETHYRVMPRTMLRYAIERFPKNKQRFYLTKS